MTDMQNISSSTSSDISYKSFNVGTEIVYMKHFLEEKSYDQTYIVTKVTERGSLVCDIKHKYKDDEEHDGKWTEIPPQVISSYKPVSYLEEHYPEYLI